MRVRVKNACEMVSRVPGPKMLLTTIFRFIDCAVGPLKRGLPLKDLQEFKVI